MRYDLTNATFDEFIAFLFDRAIAKEEEGAKPWYWECYGEIAFDPEKTLGWYTQLFSDPGFLLDEFGPDRLEQGFWAVQSCNLDCSVYHLIWMSDLDLATREECIRSMYFLFEKLFAREPLDTAPHMWWDSLTYDYYCGNRSRGNSEEEKLIQDAIFGTLTQLLSSASSTCQGAALHGLGHLGHPDTEKVITDYLDAHHGLSKEWRDYALAAMRGQIM